MTKRKSKIRTPNSLIEYCPPSAKTIDKYVSTVCQKLAEKLDGAYNSPEMRRELAGFLNVVAAIYAKHLNETSKSSLDKDGAAQ